MALGVGAQGARAPECAAFRALGRRNGFAIDFVGDRMVVNDALDPGKRFAGRPTERLTQWGAGGWSVHPEKGLDLTAGRNFSVAMPLAAFPFDPGAIHVYARFTLNAADAADQRYLLSLANTGADRFAVYTTPGAGFRWVTGDGAVSDTEVSATLPAGGIEYEVLLGADALGRTWLDGGAVQTNDDLFQIAAAQPSHLGIGGYPTSAFRVLDGYIAEIAVICEDIAPEKRLSLPAYPKCYGAEGDSHTRNVSFGLPESAFYPALIAGGSPGIVARNHGASGESSGQMLAQVQDFLARGVPEVATIYAGSNDVATEVGAVTDAQAFCVLDPTKLAAGSWLRVNGESVKIAALSGDSATLAAPLAAVPLAGDPVEIDTEANIAEWVQRVREAGTERVAVIGSHYLNFASGGDTPEAEQWLRATTRDAQKAAAAVCAVPYIDTYAYMRNLILSGAVAQGDWAVWHQGATDTHLTAAGEQVLADAIRAAFF